MSRHFVDGRVVDSDDARDRASAAATTRRRCGPVNEQPLPPDVEAGVWIDALLQQTNAVAHVDDIRFAHTGNEEVVDAEVVAPDERLRADRARHVRGVERRSGDRVMLEVGSAVSHRLDAEVA